MREDESEGYVIRGEIITKTHIDRLDPLKPNTCPHCHHGQAVVKVGAYRSCRYCGWEDDKLLEVLFEH